jgi:hypothetical protein
VFNQTIFQTGKANMQKLIPSILFVLATTVSGYAIADTDPCQTMRDQYDQVCAKPQVSNKRGAVLMGAACAMEVIAIQKCENQNNSQETVPDADEDNSQ